MLKNADHRGDLFVLFLQIKVLEAVYLIIQGFILVVIEGPFFVSIAEMPPLSVIGCEVFCKHGISQSLAVCSGFF